MTRFRKTLVPLLLGCASGLAHSQVGLPAQATEQHLAGIIDEASRRHGIDGALVHALILVESSYDAEAVSGRGALGLMQLMPETARQYGVRDPMDPAQNVEGGVRLLKDLLERFEHDLELALAAYNAGPGAVVRAGNRVPNFGETLAFVPRVLGYYRAYQVSARAGASKGDPPQAASGLGELLRLIEHAPEPLAPRNPEGKPLVAIASTRRTRRRHAARIFGTGTATLRRGPEPFRRRRGHNTIDDSNEVTMANAKRSSSRAPQVTPMPFPGESPTVSLAMAAGQMYGPSEDAAKPARSRKAGPKRKATAGRKKAAARRKATPARRASRGRAAR